MKLLRSVKQRQPAMPKPLVVGRVHIVPNCKYTSHWLQFDRPFHDSIRYHRHSCLTVNKSRTNEMSGLIELHVCAVFIAAACFCCLTKHSRLFFRSLLHGCRDALYVLR